ncbi:cytochrome c oxidase assembly protein [Marininema halotolerans]|uniref:Putative membrane protein n=1 Tax=Marininema halotolerans TaxID=1155944 RepID=A0A1I6NQ35_9BACL|nr:cytochrome c oxidase assembly protein [Marininema halotolerans]SFS30066.1 putative membrane protein [Marininema halotolerans]
MDNMDHMEHMKHMNHGEASFPGFWEMVNPGTLLLTVLFIILYFVAVHRWSKREGSGEETMSVLKKGAFVSGALIYYAATGPIGAFSHFFFSAHMTEMSLVYLVVPPLLLVGAPPTLLRKLWNDSRRKGILRFVTHPVITLLTFNGLISLYHLPVVFDTIMSRMWWMELSHVILMMCAFMMWWPLVCPLPEEDRLSPLQKLGYIFADGVLLTPACAFLAFSSALLYDSFQGGALTTAIMPPLEDQKLGGVVMKIIQELAYGSVLAYTFFGWVRKQRQQDEEELVARRQKSIHQQENDKILPSFNH